MAGKRRKHSEDFKRDAVALSYNSEKNMAEIARDLGIHRSVKSVKSWVRRLSPATACVS